MLKNDCSINKIDCHNQICKKIDELKKSKKLKWLRNLSRKLLWNRSRIIDKNFIRIANKLNHIATKRSLWCWKNPNLLMPICPICQGDGCLSRDTRMGHQHCTEPCPMDIGCNGTGTVSDYKFEKIKENTIRGEIMSIETGKKYKVRLK